MNVGICTWAFARSAAGRRDVAELAQIARESGFTGLEGAYAKRGSISVDHPPPRHLAVPVTSLATLQLHRFSFATDVPSRRQAAHQIVTEMLQCASAWSIPSVSISLGARLPGVASELQLSQVAADFAPLVALAKKLGLCLALENVPGHLLERQSAIAVLLNEFPTVGLCLDVGNTLVDPPFHRWCATFGDRVSKVHLSDGFLSGSWSPAWLGKGGVNWSEVRAFLADVQVRDVFVEVPWDGVTAETEFIMRVAETTHRLLDGVLA